MRNQYQTNNADKQFDTFYQEKIQPVLDKLEQRRRVIGRNALMIGFGVGLGVMVLFAFLFLGNGIIFGAVLGFLAATFYVNRQKDFFRDFKERVIRPVFEYVKGSIEYDPDGGLDRDTVLNTDLFRSPDAYAAEDHVKAAFDGVDVEMCEVKLQWGSGKNKKRQRGLFMKGVTHRTPESVVRIYPVDEPGEIRDKRVGDKVDLESTEFEEIFDVRGDQIEARRVLTPELMVRLLKLKDHVGNDAPYMAYDGNSVYLFLPLSKDLFEPRIFTSFRKQDVKEYVKDIQSFLEIVRIVKLSRGS